MDYLIGRVQELLRKFKGGENPNSIKFIEHDPDAVAVLTVWPDLPVLLTEPLVFGSTPQHKTNQWKYVWKFRRIDYKEIEKRTGIENRKLIQEKIHLLMTHQLIYPDGSLSKPAMAFLSSH